MLNLFQHPLFQCINLEIPKQVRNDRETAEKEVQDTSCWGAGGIPQLIKSPKIEGFGELMETISTISLD